MRKITIAFLSLMMAFNLSYAGGLVTNTNQSTAWARLLVRDASTDIDAVYFNPAGLTKLKEGFHISINNQSIFQTQYITNSFPYLNNKDYEGTVSAPLFPSIYFAYKTGRFAFSLGFNPVGGGGGAEFAKGLPAIEIPISSLVGNLEDLGVRGYSADIYFTGTSVYWGLQAGVSYELNDYISFYLGGRYVMAKNTYQGHVKDVTLNLADGSSIRADKFMKDTGDQAELSSQATQSAGDGIQPLIDNGAGDLTFDQAADAGIITEEQAEAMKGGLIQLGYPPEYVASLSISDAQATYYSAASELAEAAQELHAGALLMADQEADVTQTGNGITPIIGANLTLFNDKVNVGIKYEFKTKMDLTNSTPEGKGFVIGFNPDGTKKEMFPDGAVTNADIPAMFSIGAKIDLSNSLTLHTGFHTYFDGNTDWTDVDEKIDHNFTEYALGLEYNINDNFLISGGYLLAKTGVTDAYQSDFGFSLTTNTLGFGGAYKINDKFTVQMGGYYVMYNSQSVSGSAEVKGSAVGYTSDYLKKTYGISIGLDIALGK